jgi:hypothetical protein
MNGGMSAADPLFDRPIFIVSPPRSGSTLLFDTLASAPGVYTVGGESHGIIEGLPELQISARGFDSNVLTSDDATPKATQDLRKAFWAALRDRDGCSPIDGRVRMLEKTPKNALRVDFLASVFPEALFVYLYRDPREVMASMMEGWEQDRFITYPEISGAGRSWRFLLTPGWREFADSPLCELVAAQWATATTILLDSLERLDPRRWFVARYDSLVKAPDVAIGRLCAALGLSWDQTALSELPLSPTVVSAPRAEKWRAREQEIQAVWPKIEAAAARAHRFGVRR